MRGWAVGRKSWVRVAHELPVDFSEGPRMEIAQLDIYLRDLRSVRVTLSYEVASDEDVGANDADIRVELGRVLKIASSPT